jgi:hypothetical protein
MLRDIGRTAATMVHAMRGEVLRRASTGTEDSSRARPRRTRCGTKKNHLRVSLHLELSPQGGLPLSWAYVGG